MIAFSIQGSSLEIKNGDTVLVSMPTVYIGLESLPLYNNPPKIKLYNLAQGTNYTFFEEKLENCADGSTPFTVDSILNFAEANFGTFYVSVPPPTGGATAALQTAGNNILSSIDGKVATAAKQDTGNTSLSSIDGKVATASKQDTGNASLTSIDGKVATAAKQDTGNTSLSSIDCKVATEATLAKINTRDEDIDVTGSVTASTPLLINVEEKGTLAFSTSGTWVGTIIVEGSIDGVTWRPTTYVALSSGNVASSFSANTSGQINCVGLDFIRFSSGTITSGTANFVAMISRLVSNIMLDNPLPNGSNMIGKVQQINSGGVIFDGTQLLSNQTNGTQKTKITDGTNDATVLDGGGGYKGLVTSVGPAVFINSPANSSAGTISNGSSWTGTIDSCFLQPSTQINIVSDRNMTLLVNQYIDAGGTKKSDVFTYNIIANQGFSLCLPLAGNYINVVLTNNSGAVANYSIDTSFGTMQAVDTYGNQPVTIGQQAYGNTNAVYVGGTSQVQVQPVVTAGSAYAAGNVVGGLITLANVVNSAVLSGVLESITIAVKSLQTTSFKLYVFKSAPATTFTDKTAPAIQASDASNLLDVFSFTTPDNGLGNNVTLYSSDALNRAFVTTNANMYAVLVAQGAATFTTTSDVIVTVSVLRD